MRSIVGIMGLFSKLMSKVFGKKDEEEEKKEAAEEVVETTTEAVEEAADEACEAAAEETCDPFADAEPAPTPAPEPASAESTEEECEELSEVDVENILDTMEKAHPEDLDWKRSIVDLMKLVDMDSSYSNRKELALELGYTQEDIDSKGSAEMNMWLHKEVMRQFAANGGKVPENLLD